MPRRSGRGASGKRVAATRTMGPTAAHRMATPHTAANCERLRVGTGERHQRHGPGPVGERGLKHGNANVGCGHAIHEAEDKVAGGRHGRP